MADDPIGSSCQATNALKETVTKLFEVNFKKKKKI
jgi:hypothetical protein